MASGRERCGHFWPTSGASGDMIIGACIDAGVDVEHIRTIVAGLGLDGWSIRAERVARGGITATGLRIAIEHDVPRSWRDIRGLLVRSAIPEPVRIRSLAVFERLAVAEAGIHGVPVDDVHFHEVGGQDSIIDVVGGCAALVALDRARWTSSPVHLGHGTTRTAHGLLPIPAPATLALLQGLPVVLTDTAMELCTPTGAAMLAEWVDDWGPAGDLVVGRTGYGAGQRDLPGRANVLRLLISSDSDAGIPTTEPVIELRTLIDDMSPELLAEASARLRREGALDVWIAQVSTKKGRTASDVTCLCRPEDADQLERTLYRATTTLGIRRTTARRSVLDREERHVTVDGHAIRIKVGMLRGEIVTAQPEHDDCVTVALATDQHARRIHELAAAAFWSTGGS